MTRLEKQHDQVSVVDETKFYDQSVDQAQREEQAAPLVPATWLFSDFSHTVQGKKEIKEEEVSLAL